MRSGSSTDRLRKLAIAAALVAMAGFALWKAFGGAAGLLAGALPEFPELPAPIETPTETTSGQLTFESSTPFDLDVVLGGMQHALPTTGTGRLILPAGASALTPVPAKLPVRMRKPCYACKIAGRVGVK